MTNKLNLNDKAYCNHVPLFLMLVHVRISLFSLECIFSSYSSIFPPFPEGNDGWSYGTVVPGGTAGGSAASLPQGFGGALCVEFAASSRVCVAFHQMLCFPSIF